MNAGTRPLPAKPDLSKDAGRPRRGVWAFAAFVMILSAAAGAGTVFLLKPAPGFERETPGIDAERAAALLHGYSELLHSMYADNVKLAEALQKAIDAFVDDPSAEGFEACKRAWLRARPHYIQTEIARFYEGPIDGGSDAPEVYLNAWPLDEGYIDYVRGNPTSGIINDPVNYPMINEEKLRGANERGGEANVSTGWHAIEFLLWGQDLVDGPGGGKRSYRDYAPRGGTAANEERRGAYLRVCAAMLVKDLTFLRDQWSGTNPNNYRTWFVATSHRPALSKIMTGMGAMAFGELRGERLVVPFTLKDKEEEHSCFSDTTHLDHVNDLVGIRNVWQGRYASSDGAHDFSGPGLREVAATASTSMTREVEERLEACLEALLHPDLIPFETAIQGDDSAPGRVALQEALDRLTAFNASFFRLARRMDVPITTVLQR